MRWLRRRRRLTAPQDYRSFLTWVLLNQTCELCTALRGLILGAPGLLDLLMKGTLFALTCVAVVGSAHAADLGLANQFNAFVFGNANTNGGHADGAVAVGGNWTGSGYDVLQHNATANVLGDPKIGMYVGGNVSYSNGGSINNAGNARVKGNFFSQNPYNVNGGHLYVGGTRTGNVNGNWTDHTDTVDLGVFNTQLAYSLAQSAAIAALGGELIDTSNPNNWHINASLQGGATKVYTIDAANLGGNRTLDIANLSLTDTVLINVTGGMSTALASRSTRARVDTTISSGTTREATSTSTIARSTARCSRLTQPSTSARISMAP